MRKIRAFIMAVLLMAVFVLSAHTVTQGLSLKVDNGRFGFWFNPYKDLSYGAGHGVFRIQTWQGI